MSWLTRMLIRDRGPRRGNGQLGGLIQAVRDLEVGLLEDEGSLIGIGANDADHHRYLAAAARPGLDDAMGHLVAAGDPAEDVDQDGPDVRIGQDDPEGGGHPLVARAAADVEEVRRLAAGELDEVHGGHRQAGPVHHAADRAVQLDVADARRAGRDLGRLFLGEVAHGLDIGVAGQGRVVDDDLRVEGEQAAVAGYGHRVDLGQLGVRAVEGGDQPLDDGCESRTDELGDGEEFQ